MNKKLTADELNLLIGVLMTHYSLTKAFTIASIFAGKHELVSNDLDRANELGRTMVRDVLSEAGGDESILKEIDHARTFFGTPEEHEAKRAAARAAYHQRELTKQPG